MQKISVKVKRLANFQGELPSYGSTHASGFDLVAMLPEKLTLRPGERALVPTGLSFEIPPGFEIQVRPRSGWAIKKGVSVVNTPGTVDADYRGEVQVGLINFGHETMEILPGDRMAQAVLCPVVQAVFEDVAELGSTARGAGGFGSTGFSGKNAQA